MRFLLVKSLNRRKPSTLGAWENAFHSPLSISLTKTQFPTDEITGVFTCHSAPAWSFLGLILQQMKVSLWRVRLGNPYFFQLPGDSAEQTGLEFAGLGRVSSFFQFKNLMYLGIGFCRHLSRHRTGNSPKVLMLLGHWDMVLKT